MEAPGLVPDLSDRLSKSGIDIVAPLQLHWYNKAIPNDLGARIAPSGSAGSRALCILIGNSKLAWEPFLKACSTQGLLTLEHPFNSYVEAAVESSLKECAVSTPYRIYWSHKRYDDLEGGCQYVAMQRMAHAIGLAYLDQDSHLCLHPKFGPWFSLRCVVVFEDLVHTGHKPHRLHNPMCPTTRHYVQLAMSTAIHCAERRCSAALQRASADLCRASSKDSGSAAAPKRRRHSLDLPSRAVPKGPSAPTAAALLAATGPQAGDSGACQLGSSPCAVTDSSAGSSRRSSGESERMEEDGQQQEEQQLGAGEGSEYGFAVHDAKVAPPPPKPSMDAVRSTWRKWVAVRDAPCPGHPWRYSDEQLTYHYTADRQVLLQALARRNLVQPAAAPACLVSSLAPTADALAKLGLAA